MMSQRSENHLLIMSCRDGNLQTDYDRYRSSLRQSCAAPFVSFRPSRTFRALPNESSHEAEQTIT